MPGNLNQPEEYANLPLVRTHNDLTGHLIWEDKGFREMKVQDNGEKLTEIPVTQMPLYDGVDEFGEPETVRTFGGGVNGGIILVRESAARLFEQAERDLQKHFGKDIRIVAHDGFRHYRRQMSMYQGDFKANAEKYHVNGEPSVEQLIDLGERTDEICSWVPPVRGTAEYNALVEQLRKDSIFMAAIRGIAARKNGVDEATPEQIDDTLFSYIAISTNANIGLARDAKIDFDFENNPHAGGAAVDALIQKKVNGKWVPMSITPMDYPGACSALDYMEHDENYEKYCKLISGKNADPVLRRHVERMGFKPDNFRWEDWCTLRNIKRIHVHLFTNLGATFYSAENSEDGGEHWHAEPGAYYNDILTGREAYRRTGTEQFGLTGNPGHTLQKQGPNGIAVYGGTEAHKQVDAKWGLAQ